MSRPKTGSVTKLANGKHWARITLPNGTRIPLGCHADEDAAWGEIDAHLHVLNAELADGMTVAAWGEKYLTERELQKVIVDGKPRRVVVDMDNEWSRFNRRIKPDAIGKVPVCNVTRLDAVEFAKRLRTSLSAQSTRNIMQIMRSMFAAAHDRGLCRENPFIKIKVAPDRRTSPPWTFATPEEQTKLLDQFPGPERWIVAFAMGTGLRAGELISLRLADVDTKSDEPHVVVRYGSAPANPTKTGKIRRVPLFGLGLHAARAWRAQLKEYAPSNPHRLMFPRKRGEFRDEDHVLTWAVWSKARTEAFGKERGFRWHDLRHTCGSSLVSGWWGRAWSLVEVRDMLGHSTVTLTERYAHLGDTALRAAARATDGGKAPQGFGYEAVTPEISNQEPSEHAHRVRRGGCVVSLTHSQLVSLRDEACRVGVAPYETTAYVQTILDVLVSLDDRARAMAQELAELGETVGALEDHVRELGERVSSLEGGDK